MFESLPVCDCSELHPSAVERARRSMPDAELLDGLTNFFKVLGDKTRTGIVCALDGNELCVCDLAALLGMTKSAYPISWHISKTPSWSNSGEKAKTCFILWTTTTCSPLWKWLWSI